MRFRRLMVPVLWVLGCSPYQSRPLAITEVSPASGMAGTDTPVTITGESFRVGALFDLDDESRSELRYTFEVRLGNTPLVGVALDNETTLRATVPARYLANPMSSRG